MKINQYSPTKSASSVTLPKEFVVEPNEGLLAQAIHVYRDRSHTGSSKTKTRSEVAISTRKIYRQKGTGGARHGAKSAPIFVGGGTAHGPKAAQKVLTLPKKMRRKALLVATYVKAVEGKMAFYVDIKSVKKTSDAQKFIDKVRSGQKAKQNSNVTVVLSKENALLKNMFSNLTKVNTVRAEDLNAYDVFFGGIVLLENQKKGAEK